MKNNKNLFRMCAALLLGASPLFATAQTFNNEAVTATWPLSTGVVETATVSLDGAFTNTMFEMGKDVTDKGLKAYGGVTFNCFQPASKQSGATAGHEISFTLTPSKGLTFTPGNVTFKAMKNGTGGGIIDVVFRSADGSERELQTGIEPNRNNNNNPVSEFTVPVTDATALSETSTIVFYIYNLDNKNIGISDVTIDGTINGTAASVTKYTLTTGAMPGEEAGNVTVKPAGTSFDEGTSITVTAKQNFGFRFVKWVDENNTEVSTVNPYTFDIAKNTTLNAVFEAVTTYAFSTRCINDFEMPFGSITLSPEPTNGRYEAGTEVTVTANETPVARFSNWADDFENSNLTVPTRTVTVTSDMEIVANYTIEDFIVVFNADKEEAYANRGSYPFAAAYTWDNERNANACVVKVSDNTVLKGNGSCPVIRLRKNAVTSTVSGLFINGYRSTDIAFQTQFSTVGFTSARFTGTLIAKNAATCEWQVLYSLNGTDFNPVLFNEAPLIIETATSGVSVDFDLPEEAIGQPTVFIRFTGYGDAIFSEEGKYPFNQLDEESGLNYCTNSEAGLGNVFVFGSPIIEDDNIAPEVKNIAPANQATGVSSSGKIMITFNERISAGSGEAVLSAANGDRIVLEPTYGSSSVSFRYNNLAYATTYTLNIPSGYVTDRSGNNAPAIESTFTVMKRNKPAARVFNAIVDGSLEASIAPSADAIGQYKTIQEAINAVPSDNAAPWLIFVKEGYYNDLNHLSFPTGKYSNGTDGSTDASEDSRIVLVNKPFVHLIGQDVNKVTIAQDRVSGGAATYPDMPWYNVAEGATLVVTANDFYCENITIDNEWWTKKKEEGPQALALYVEADRAVFNNCRIRSYQDTYLSSKTGNQNSGNQQPHFYDRQFMNNCFIEGAVDFIYGGGDVYFDNCTLNIVRESGGYIVAPCHYADLKDQGGNVTEVRTRYGYVFKNTTITAPAGKEATTQVYFGRPWQNAPKTVFIDTECRIKTYDGLWYYRMGAIPAIFAVYNMYDANGYPMNTTSIEDYEYTDNGTVVKGKAKNSLTDEEAAAYTMTAVFEGDKSDAVTGYWNPAPMVEKTSVPAISSTKGSTTFSWEADPYAICYVVTVNGKVAGFTTETSYTANLNDIVSVQSVNEFGALSEPSANFTVGGGSSSVSEVADAHITIDGNRGYISVRGIEEATVVEVYSLAGALVESMKVSRNISIAMPAGNYLVKAGAASAKVVVR